MVIGGLQKLTLIDYPGKIACTVFTVGCNFRCGFCHNPELISLKSKDFKPIKEKDFFDWLKEQQGYLDGVCITGGEPTLHKDLIEFIKKIKKLGFLIKLDTNGSNPSVLKKLIKANLVDYIAMDIKNQPDKYHITTGCGIDIKKVKESVDLIKNSQVDYEFRTTILPSIHTKEDIMEIAKWLKGADKYYLQQFRKGKTLDEKLSNVDPYSDKEMNYLCRLIKSNFYLCKVRLND